MLQAHITQTMVLKLLTLRDPTKNNMIITKF